MTHLMKDYRDKYEGREKNPAKDDLGAATAGIVKEHKCEQKEERHVNTEFNAEEFAQGYRPGTHHCEYKTIVPVQQQLASEERSRRVTPLLVVARARGPWIRAALPRA
jgi:hypothetical protein